MDYLFRFADEDIKRQRVEAKTSRKAALYRALDNRNTFKITIGNSRVIPGKGVALQGAIDSGTVKKGDLIRFNGQPGQIVNIERFGQTIEAAGYPWTNPLQPVTLLISGIENEKIYTGLQVIDIIKPSNGNSNFVNTTVQSESKHTTADNTETFAMEISDIFTITGRGTVLAGRILNGKISVGDKVTVDGKQGTISGIEKFRRLIDSASADDGEIGLLVSGLKKGEASVNSVIRKIK